MFFRVRNECLLAFWKGRLVVSGVARMLQKGVAFADMKKFMVPHTAERQSVTTICITFGFVYLINVTGGATLQHLCIINL